MKNILECKNVSIRYIIGDFKDIGFKEFFIRKIMNNYHITEFWADNNISFELKKGDMLGIIGSNGAGKSTLLKAISGVMIPTNGNIIINGKIAALLELTAGFDGDLTVKENTYLRGAMLGYTRKFMDDMYDPIMKFSELEKFQDRPYKQLSSGMKSRLAFSIACLVNPDILILDEVLSVGDGAFRKKSGNKMKEILNSGVTGILVSHSTEQIRELCNKILWLDHGKQICFSEDVDMYLNAYEEFLITKKIPNNKEDAVSMSNNFINRQKTEENLKIKKEISKFESLIENGNDNAIEAAINIIKKNKPEILKKNI